MIIKSRFKNYEVSMEADLAFLQKLQEIENALFVIDKKVYELYEEHFNRLNSDKLMLVEASEENKVIQTALDICEKMTNIPAKRNAVLISVGGGIIQDLTGFVANILYRGIKWIFVPTTLLASCDSCIGGKTSLNYKKYKNLLGTFYPPDSIYICPSFFKTLSEKDYKSGLGEVVKFNLMAGQEGLSNMESNIAALLSREDGIVSDFVLSSLEFKKGFIEEDEFDKGERIKLNFAHTFGHAIEVISSYEIPHGTAVAIGMIIADRISLERQLLDEEFVLRAESILLQVIDIDVAALQKPLEQIIDAMRKDKKQTSEALTAVLMTGKARELLIVHDIEQSEVGEAFRYFTTVYSDK